MFDRSTVVTTTVTRRLMATNGAERLRLLQEGDAHEYFTELREKIAAERDAVRRAELTNELSVAEEIELCRAALEIRLPDATLDGKLVLDLLEAAATDEPELAGALPVPDAGVGVRAQRRRCSRRFLAQPVECRRQRLLPAQHRLEDVARRARCARARPPS